MGIEVIVGNEGSTNIMGADSTLIFYGIRFEVLPEETEGLELKTDSRLLRARDAHLEYWWGNFAVDELQEACYLFVGKLLATVGHEGVYNLVHSPAELASLFERTDSRLASAGVEGDPALYVQFEPDY